jgi:His-Xaa-Ser system radical SAM maturase HxsC
VKIFSGESGHSFEPFLAEVTHSKPLFNRSGKVFISTDSCTCPIGFRGMITATTQPINGSKPSMVLDANDLSGLVDGDFVVMNSDGTVSVIWEAESSSNTIFATPACDCRCIMCPQPPQKHDEGTFNIAMELLDRLDPAKVTKICVTGGEPTLMGDKFISMMRKIKKRFDHALVMILTNGKNFSDFALTKEYAAIGLSNSLTCVSFHSDIEELNDKIAGVKGSFHKTTQGLYNLARFKQKIEIRHVVSRLNHHRLEEFASFIYRNFPFAYHVAIMGMEVTGYALENYEDLWIDPYEYRQSINNALRTLQRAYVNVSIYNIPLCLLEKSSWTFARQSISEWKNTYIEECNGCKLRSECCGVFTTSGDKISNSIRIIL